MEKTILEGNKLIAEFMGATTKEFDKYYFREHPVTFKESGDGLFIRDEDLKYHSSWDWLMPVVQKIESLGFTVIVFSGCCDIEHKGDGEFEPIQSGGGQPKILSTWQSVIQFIEWYNKTKTNESD